MALRTRQQMAAVKSLVHDIIDAIKHLLYIYDYQLVVADPRTGYKYFLYTRPFDKLAERVEGVDGSKCISELKLKCAIVGIDFDKQVDKWELHRNIFDIDNDKEEQGRLIIKRYLSIQTNNPKSKRLSKIK